MKVPEFDFLKKVLARVRFEMSLSGNSTQDRVPSFWSFFKAQFMK